MYVLASQCWYIYIPLIIIYRSRITLLNAVRIPKLPFLLCFFILSDFLLEWCFYFLTPFYFSVSCCLASLLFVFTLEQINLKCSLEYHWWFNYTIQWLFFIPHFPWFLHHLSDNQPCHYEILFSLDFLTQCFSD